MATLRIALAGTMANNLYNTCCNLRMCGVEATLFLDGSDSFAMGQPVWEEVPLCLSREELQSRSLNFDAWMALSTRHIPDDGRLCVLRRGADGNLVNGLSTPKGIKYAFRGGDLPAPAHILQRAADLVRGLPDNLVQMVMGIAISRMHFIRALSSCDVIVASQFHECVMAALTGKPVRYIVYGADWDYVLDDMGGHNAVESQIFEHFLKRGAIVHGGFNWKSILDISFKHGLAPRWLHSPESFINLASAVVPRDRQTLRRDLGLANNAFIVLLPSRVDTAIKKTDMLLRAFSVFTREHPEAVLITAGWGNDLENMMQQFPLENIRFLNHVMSKPRLFDYMAAADVVADQFASGCIGSTGREALAVGRPLLAFVSPCFQWSFDAPSPILNAASEEDILHWLHLAATQPQSMEERGSQGRQWLLKHMDPIHFTKELCVLAEYGAEKTLAFAPTLRTDILEHEMDCPRGQCSLQICRWPWPYVAGLSLSNGCEYYTWKHFCALHSFMANKDMPTPWGRGLGLPFSDSFWFYDDSASGISWFQGTGFRPSVYAPFMKELVNAGFLDAIHAWGEFDATAGFGREHAERAAAVLAGLTRTPSIFTNHGSLRNHQNVGGRFALPYHQGDVPGTPQYHTDILRELGVRWFWSDEGVTHQCSLLTSTTPLPADGVCKPDEFPWSGQILYKNQLRDGQYVHSFRRMRGTLPKAPTASTLPRQLNGAYLDYLEATRGGVCIYQHLGCWRGLDGRPLPFAGNVFPGESLRALEDLATRYHAKRIWCSTVQTFLRYVHAVQNVVVEPVAHEGWLELQCWFLSGDLTGDRDLDGLSLLVRSRLPVKKVIYEDSTGQWNKACPTITALDDGRQLVHWPWIEPGSFPFTGSECP